MKKLVEELRDYGIRLCDSAADALEVQHILLGDKDKEIERLKEANRAWHEQVIKAKVGFDQEIAILEEELREERENNGQFGVGA